MPSSCVQGCGLIVDGNAITLDWGALGVKYGSEVDDNAFSSAVPARTDGFERMRTIRARFTNNSCQTHLITYWAEIPHLNMNMVAGNYWDTALYCTGQSGSQPSATNFNVNNSARCRLAHPGGGQVMRMSWGSVQTTRRRDLVAPGATYHMLASFWRSIIDRQDHAENRLSWPSMSLKYEAIPIS